MAITLGNIAATISLDARRWVTGAKKVSTANKAAQRSAYNLQRRIDKTVKAFGKFGQSLKRVALVVAAAVAGFSIAAKAQIQIADEVAKTSRRLGVSAEFLQALQYAADSYNIAQGQILKGLQKVQTEVSKINSGVYSEAATELRKLDAGLLATLRTATSTEEIYRILDTRFRSVSRSQAIAVAGLLFGNRSAAAVVQFSLERGFTTAEKRARELGLLTTDEIEKAEKLNQAFTDLSTTIKFSMQRALIENRDTVIETVDNFTELAVTLAPKLVSALSTISDLAVDIKDNWRDIAQAALTFAGAVGGFKLGAKSRNPYIALFSGIMGGISTHQAGRYLLRPDGTYSDNPPLKIDIHAPLQDAVSGRQLPTGPDPLPRPLQELIDALPGKLAEGQAAILRDLARQIKEAQGLSTRDKTLQQLEALLEPLRNRLIQERANLVAAQGTPSQLQQLQVAIDSLDISNFEKIIQKIEDMNEELEKTIMRQKQIDEIAGGINASFQQGIELLIQTGSVAQGLRSILGGILAQIIRTLIISPIASSAAGFFKDIFSPAENAYGGHLIAGKYSVVGERGPELVAFNQSSRIIPNHDLRLGGGGATISIINTGTDKSIDEEATRINMEEGIIEVVLKDLRLNGPIAQNIAYSTGTGNQRFS